MSSRPPEPSLAPAGAPEKARLGIWTFLATEVLLFGGLFTAYTVFRIAHPAQFHSDYLQLNRLFGALNTVVLICSSLSVAIGIAAIRQGKERALQRCLIITLLLAAAFLGIKYLEWSDHFAHGIYPRTSIFFALYYTMTGLHALHVMAGMGALTTMLVLARRGKFSAEYSTPVEITGIYWHFVDLVWIYLFPLLYLIG
ncbi:cytochrome c oxidase subunit III [Geotalea uraniireducens]|uniref:Cytochrome c oxidase subunit III n=1 Tax=Geotalea uraniireducens TaxID=351604 RepID=A0ABM8EK59_9BACT|nr:cytochrome c oxidase subunit 3 family protein [Geotalea uraniireducens]BDV42793.1 cytochrome c oxidase subunit III [Geotalea uraniireducens]